MLIDTTRFPLVFLMEDQQEQAEAPDAQAQLSALLGRGERFVLMTDHLPGSHPEESHEERKRRALFFKHNRERLRQLCAGLLVITGDRAIPAPVRFAAQGVGKLLGLPFDFVRSESDAVTAAVRLLDG